MRSQTPDVDLIVLGSGAGGMTAALTASVLGLNVLVVEKAAVVGGTTSRSAGAVWIPNSRHSKTGDTPQQALAYLRVSLGNRLRESMVAAFLRAGPQMIGFLEDNTSVAFRAFAHHPDYLAALEGATLSGRVLEPVPFNAAVLGKHLATLRRPLPEFTLLGGMMVDRVDIGHLLNATKSLASLQHVAGLVGRYGADRLRFGRGARLVMGNALAGRLYYSLLQRHVPFEMLAEARSLIEREGRVAGVVLQTSDGLRDVGSRCGVVLATGGISRHLRLRQQLMPAALRAESPVVESATGDGAMLAQATGAHLGDNHASNAFWAPISMRPRRDGSTAVFPHLVLDRGKPGLIAINPDGKRFVSEATDYHLFVEAMLAELASRPTQPCFLICDDDFMVKYGLGMVRPRRLNLRKAVAQGYVVRASNLEGLAAELGVPARALSAVVERHNRFARTGVDEDFGKGNDAYQRNLGDAAHAPNPCIGPLAKSPFYAVKIYPGDIGASCGMVTNECAQVLRKDGSTVDGLYACGNDMDSIMAGIYPGPGITLGPALTFGYLAARHAAEHRCGGLST
ncbi:MAG TPA: FAD-dependent oxidoreductase [Hyphomicrobiaceae bacterium]|nr:FAD-dependent oxidoreductase [Hyphomicrobiaceae bacterium]